MINEAGAEGGSVAAGAWPSSSSSSSFYLSQFTCDVFRMVRLPAPLALPCQKKTLKNPDFGNFLTDSVSVVSLLRTV